MQAVSGSHLVLSPVSIEPSISIVLQNLLMIKQSMLFQKHQKLTVGALKGFVNTIEMLDPISMKT